MWDIIAVEESILEMIGIIKNKHERPSMEAIFNGINKAKGAVYELSIDMFKQAIDGMIDQNRIKNRGRNGEDSYRVCLTGSSTPVQVFAAKPDASTKGDKKIKKVSDKIDFNKEKNKCFKIFDFKVQKI